MAHLSTLGEASIRSHMILITDPRLATPGQTTAQSSVQCTQYGQILISRIRRKRTTSRRIGDMLSRGEGFWASRVPSLMAPCLLWVTEGFVPADLSRLRGKESRSLPSVGLWRRDRDPDERDFGRCGGGCRRTWSAKDRSSAWMPMDHHQTARDTRMKLPATISGSLLPRRSIGLVFPTEPIALILSEYFRAGCLLSCRLVMACAGADGRGTLWRGR